MNAYNILLKKGDLRIELSSDDDYFISKQLDKWYKALLSQDAPNLSGKTSSLVKEPASADVPSLSEPLLIAPEPSSQEPLEPSSNSAPNEAFQDASVEGSPEIVAESIQQAIPLSSPVSSDPHQSVPEIENVEDMGIDLQEHAQEDSMIALSPEVEDDFEAVIASIKEDMDKPDIVAAHEVSLPQFAVAQPPQNLDSLSDHKAPSVSGLDLSMIDSLADLYEHSNASSSEDFLMLSAYYLTFCAQEPYLSLKQINALIVKTGLTPVNHSVLEKALENQWLAMVPETDAMADVTKYCLTSVEEESGKAYVERLF